MPELSNGPGWASSDQPQIELGGLLDGLEAAAPSPAGGTAAAVVAAMSASLVVMIGRGSPAWPEGRAAALAAATLRDRLLALGADDVRAFEGLLSAFRVSRDPEAGDVGTGELVRALLFASEVPLAIAERAADVVELAARAASSGKRPMRPDAHVAAILAEAATRAASEIVRVNLAAVPGDWQDAEKERLLGAARAVRERAGHALQDDRGGRTDSS